jgi:hypothetical protein
VLVRPVLLGVDHQSRVVVDVDDSCQVHGLLLWGAEIVQLHALMDDNSNHSILIMISQSYHCFIYTTKETLSRLN